MSRFNTTDVFAARLSMLTGTLSQEEAEVLQEAGMIPADDDMSEGVAGEDELLLTGIEETDLPEAMEGEVEAAADDVTDDIELAEDLDQTHASLESLSDLLYTALQSGTTVSSEHFNALQGMNKVIMSNFGINSQLGTSPQDYLSFESHANVYELRTNALQLTYEEVEEASESVWQRIKAGVVSAASKVKTFVTKALVYIERLRKRALSIKEKASGIDGTRVSKGKAFKHEKRGINAGNVAKSAGASAARIGAVTGGIGAAIGGAGGAAVGGAVGGTVGAGLGTVTGVAGGAIDMAKGKFGLTPKPLMIAGKTATPAEMIAGIKTANQLAGGVLGAGVSQAAEKTAAGIADMIGKLDNTDTFNLKQVMSVANEYAKFAKQPAPAVGDGVIARGSVPLLGNGQFVVYTPQKMDGLSADEVKAAIDSFKAKIVLTEKHKAPNKADKIEPLTPQEAVAMADACLELFDTIDSFKNHADRNEGLVKTLSGAVGGKVKAIKADAEGGKEKAKKAKQLGKAAVGVWTNVLSTEESVTRWLLQSSESCLAHAGRSISWWNTTKAKAE